MKMTVSSDMHVLWEGASQDRSQMINLQWNTVVYICAPWTRVLNSLVLDIEFDISVSHSISSLTQKWNAFSNHLLCQGCVRVILKIRPTYSMDRFTYMYVVFVHITQGVCFLLDTGHWSYLHIVFKKLSSLNSVHVRYMFCRGLPAVMIPCVSVVLVYWNIIRNC